MLNMNESRRKSDKTPGTISVFFFTATTRHEIEVGFESNCDVQERKSQGNDGLVNNQ